MLKINGYPTNQELKIILRLLLQKRRQLYFHNPDPQPMQGRGLFNKTITSLAEMIYTETTLKNSNHLITKALALGMPVNESFNRQRILFVITQTIITLIDQIVAHQRQDRPIKHQQSIKIDQPFPQPQEKSTLKHTPKCLIGNLNISVLIYQMFCPRTLIWDIIEKVSAIKQQLEKQDGIFEVVKLQNRIFRLEDYSSQHNHYHCSCTAFQLQTETQQIINCHHCLQEFHPACQSNPILCNSCFLRFCVMDLKDELTDPFNLNKEVKIKFFGYMRNSFPDELNNQVSESIYFHVVKFTLNGFEQQADRKLRYVQIRICVVDKIFPDELMLPLKPYFKLKKDTNFFWQLDDVEYYFYLNHIQVKFTTAISKNCIIFKVPHRILQKLDNILIIKTIRRNQKYNYKDSNTLAYWPEKQNTTKILMIGVFQINKKKLTAKNKNERLTLQPTQDRMREITVYQSYHYLQFVQKKINQVPYQIVNLYNNSGSRKIQIPVRSFGCHHVECFDYAEFKQAQKVKRDSLKPPKTMKKKQKRCQAGKEKEGCIEIQSSSSDVIEIIEQEQDKVQPQNRSFQSIDTSPSKKIFKTQSVQVGRKKKHHNEIKQVQQLLCPICQRRLLILYEDPLFKQMLFNSGFYKKVKILNNGQYTFEDIPKLTQRYDQIQILH